MQQSHLSLSDSEPSIGSGRLNLSNPPLPPDSPRVEPPEPSYNTLDLLAAQQDAMVAYIHHLESRIIELEGRTWWSMLVDWVCFWK